MKLFGPMARDYAPETTVLSLLGLKGHTTNRESASVVHTPNAQKLHMQSLQAYDMDRCSEFTWFSLAQKY